MPRVNSARLYKALGPHGNSSFATILQLLNLLGVGVSVHPQRTGRRHLRK
jgi:DNA-binding phage protein